MTTAAANDPSPAGTTYLGITERTTLEVMLVDFPETVEVFEWYGIDIDRYDADTTMYECCRDEQVDLEDMLIDLRLAVAERRNTDTNGEDN